MRILLVHNYYGSGAPSGENRVFEMERGLLENHGHEVVALTRNSDEIRAKGVVGACIGALSTAWNPWMARAALEKVEAFRPDIVHVHNTFPLISPSVFSAIGGRSKRILTLHNYRTVCPAAIPLRDGKVCTVCIDRRSIGAAIRHGCYRGSRLATLPLAANVALHRVLGTWQKQVDAFIVLSDFQKQVMSAAGFPADKMFVKPNYVAGSPAVTPWGKRVPAVVFVGRLSQEKGVATLVEAWRLWGPSAPELRLVGDGPLRDELSRAARGLPVRFLGRLSGEEAQQQIARAKLLILPSECYETFGMVLVEAFACGTPVAATALEPLTGIVTRAGAGVLFPPADPAALLESVLSFWSDGTLLARKGAAARAAFEQTYTEQANYQTLLSIYERVLER